MPKKANLRKKRQTERRKLAEELSARHAGNRRFKTTRREPMEYPELGLAALALAAVAAGILKVRGQ